MYVTLVTKEMAIKNVEPAFSELGAIIRSLKIGLFDAGSRL